MSESRHFQSRLRYDPPASFSRVSSFHAAMASGMGGLTGAGRHHVNHFLGRDAAFAVAQCALDPAQSGEAVTASKSLFNVEPSIVPADQARGELEGAKEGQRAAIGDPRRADEGLPPGTENVSSRRVRASRWVRA